MKFKSFKTAYCLLNAIFAQLRHHMHPYFIDSEKGNLYFSSRVLKSLEKVLKSLEGS